MHRTRLAVWRVSSAVAILEPLEKRQLLSSTLLDGPGMTAHPLDDGTIPAGSATPPGYSPVQIRHAYGIDSIAFGGTTGDGTGQTVAIIGAYNDPKLVDSTVTTPDSNGVTFDTSDLHMFDEEFGIPDPPSFTKVDETGGTNFPTTDPSWANESAMDVEWVHAIAPKASIILVECNTPNLNDLVQAGVDYARSQPGVSVVSMSFAADEASGESFYDTYFTTPTSHQGVTFVAGTGDDGSPGEYPAFSPNVLAIGATTLTLSGTDNYGSEVGYADSGGGTSQYEGKPAYQDDVTTPSDTFRSIPDVAFDGDDNTGVSVYDSFNGGSATPWYKVGGTSFSAPAWSGIMAIVNQGRVIGGQTTLDGPSQTLPRIYELNSSDFNDITTGSNGLAAGGGYDQVTGRGTPKANLLAVDLAGGGASISGTIYNDVNGDGSQDNGEPGLAGFTVYLDLHGTNAFVAGDPSTTTNSDGTYTLSDIPAGTFTVEEEPLNGYQQTTPSTGGVAATVAFGQSVTGKNIANQQSVSISGFVFSDTNGDGVREIGENPLVSWTPYLDIDNSGSVTSADVLGTTAANGSYSFTNLTPGTYHVRLELQAGYTQSLPASGGYLLTVKAGLAATGANFAAVPAVTTGAVKTGALPPVTSGASTSDESPAATAKQAVILPANNTFAESPITLPTGDAAATTLLATDWKTLLSQASFAAAIPQ